jgi:uncharacterized membrane protein
MVEMSKINRARTWGLLFILIGMGIMILGLVGIVYDWGMIGKIIAYISMILGLLAVFASMAIYFWAGMISTNSPVVQCPRCERNTKVVGVEDHCMYCHTRLSFDPKYKREATNES